MRVRAGNFLVALVLGLGLGVVPRAAEADDLAVEVDDADDGYVAVEELSYETIIEASDRYHSLLKLRIALHNSSVMPRDTVLTVGLPHASELRGLGVAKGGVWTTGKVTQTAVRSGRRDPGAVYARQLAPQSPGDIPAAEVVAFSIQPGSTIQVELRVRVYPRLRGKRWEIELPSRGDLDVGMATVRRVLVKGLRDRESFWVDGVSSGREPVIKTTAEDAVVVAWPSRLRSASVLEGHYEVSPSHEGRGGSFRTYLRLGQTRSARPDHLVILVDRSHSTDGRLQKQSARMVARLLDALPANATFDAIGFARSASPLLGEHGGKPPRVSDRNARDALAKALDAGVREQGTDLAGALRVAAERASSRRAKRPLILVVTDGMLPLSVDPPEIRRAFESGISSRRRRPDILFVVDDDMLLTTGLASDHPVARVAAGLGARISQETLAQLHPRGILELLGAPRVLGELDIGLTREMKLDTELPPGLVSGNVVLLHGTYSGPPPRQLEVRGRFGAKRITRVLRINTRTALPHALAGSIDGTEIDAVAREGFAHPPWYTRRDQRLAQLRVTQAGRGGPQDRGKLDQGIFRYYLRTRVRPRAQVCFNHAITRNRDQAGHVMLEMEVGKGEVMVARTGKSKLAVADPKLLECLTEAAWKLGIPAAKLDDRVYFVRYPLRFRRTEGARATPKGDPLGEGTLEILLRPPPIRKKG